MARLQQNNPQNYRTTERISQEFENLVRYINAAEFGDKTLSELLGQLFNDDGVWAGPVEFRFDGDVGIQVRLGTYTDAEEGWVTAAPIDNIKGAAGSTLGTISVPFISGRQDTLATASQTVFSYTGWTDEDDLLVYVNGVLQVEGASNDYQKDAIALTVTFNSGLNLNDTVSIFRLRTLEIENFQRSDITAVDGQVIFPFVHDEENVLVVYKNGILQRPGGSYDYVSSADTDTVTMIVACSAGDVVTIVTVDETNETSVPGLMTEDGYTDGNGLIPYTKMSFQDGEVPASKITGLSDFMSVRGKISISATTPTDSEEGDFWLDTSTSPNTFKVYNGYQWIDASPESALPSFSTSDAGYVLKVSSSGDALEFAPIDLSSRIPISYMGVANGVAELDSSGFVPLSQLPSAFSQDTLYKFEGSAADGSYTIQLVHAQSIRIDTIVGVASAGTCTIQIEVDGTPVGDTLSVSTTMNSANLSSSIEVDAGSTPKRIGFVVTSASGLGDLEVALGVTALTV